MTASDPCAAFRDELAAYRAGALTGDRSGAHAAHLDTCHGCAEALAADAALDGLLTQEPTNDSAAVARLSAFAADLTHTSAPAAGQPQPLPWAWVAALAFLLVLAISADWRGGPPPNQPTRDPWRYRAPQGLDRHELPQELPDQPLPGELTWRVL